VAGEPLGVEDVRDVLLALQDHDPGVGQGGGHGPVSAANGSRLSEPVSSSVGTMIRAARAGSKATREMARSSRTIVGAAATRAGQAGWARRTASSASGIRTTSRNMVSTTASRSPAVSSASSRSPTLAGSPRAAGSTGGHPS
jgi:hypothetical protein